MLSGVQQRNLEKAWARPVVDRVGLIIDIFAQRAHTKEAQLQVDPVQVLRINLLHPRIYLRAREIWKRALSSANCSPCRADFTCIGFRAPLIGLAWHVSCFLCGRLIITEPCPMQPLVHLISRKGLFWDLHQMNVQLLPGVRSCCIWA